MINIEIKPTTIYSTKHVRIEKLHVTYCLAMELLLGSILKGSGCLKQTVGIGCFFSLDRTLNCKK